MLTKKVTRDKMSWARELMEAEGLSQKDVARAWEVSESSVSRWLDGLQSTDLSLHRAVKFSRLVHRSLEEIATRLGHDVWTADGVPRVQPLPSPSKPPVPTVNVDKGSRDGLFLLLLHLELRATDLAAIISTLEVADPVAVKGKGKGNDNNNNNNNNNNGDNNNGDNNNRKGP